MESTLHTAGGDTPDLDRRWTNFGLWCGLIAGVCYFYRFLRPVVDLPGALALVPWFLFGPFFGLFAVGLYHHLRPRATLPLVQAATLLTVLSSTFVTAMFVVQSATFDIGFKFIRAASDKAAETAAYQIMNTVNAAQLGLGMCWDIFVSLGTALFAVCFMQLGTWGKLLGILGLTVAIGALAFNFATFPMPPAESGLIDLGPGIAVWYVVVAVPMLVAARRRPLTSRSS